MKTLKTQINNNSISYTENHLNLIKASLKLKKSCVQFRINLKKKNYLETIPAKVKQQI